MSHLSELSIQLRKLQAEKNAQVNEIDRLERQLRILSDLKGISINDLKHALRSACEAEAHGELCALVGTLQAKVEELQLGGGVVGGIQRVIGLNADADNIPSLDRFNQEAAARARSALELRIGELEEIESNHQRELDSLNTTLQELTHKNTLLETQVMQQNAQLEQWELRWQAKEEDDTKRSSLTTASSTGGAFNYSEFSKSSVSSHPGLLHNAPQSQVDADHKQCLIAAHSALVGEKKQRLLVQSQLSSAQKKYELKSDQYLHRIQFLEEQLRDLELQMTSLYAAFSIIQNDNTEEKMEKEAWKRSLVESDSALAKEESKRELQQRMGPESPSAVAVPVAVAEHSSRRSVPMVPSPPLSRNSHPSSVIRASVKPSAHPPIVKGLLLLLLDSDDQPLSPNVNPSLSTQRKKSFSARKLYPMKSSSKLLSSSARNTFKKQYCVLHGANGLYQIRYGDSYEGPVAGVHEFITAGVSSIEVSSFLLHF
jgi:hypothetical protein